ncbi:uncharacterized protein PGTG_00888 [Puccinia graminis f. sp. tritici CRL 75-36-700-3]|uniref:Uncharacterized protein n=1 Tax=Puccinia graminis f. sp. tritici (strain CRL 75-36-700-3 / race SCCL) TaxID=418459 RepID=E3JU32_PUCGT|nr:uncharacterized protein PGTG_00888 [Puccinia graminis f. sp. tritici CRL 75-36-700-3]EFP75557.2 hypothetical protein PGTG_00888 [Puccinia graminis f. sp. tritici CRL 75-36-700-3]
MNSSVYDIELDLALGLPVDRSEPNTKRQKVAQGSSESVARGQSGNKNQWNNPTNFKPELALGLSFDHSASQNQKQPVSSASLEFGASDFNVWLSPVGNLEKQPREYFIVI